MTRSELNRQLGCLAEKHIVQTWLARHPDHTVIADGYLYRGGNRQSLRRNWNTLSGIDDRYLGVLRLMMQTDAKAGSDVTVASVPGQSRKVDLLSLDARSAWEFKPAHERGVAAGARQLAIYLALLDIAEREYLALAKHPRYRSHSPLAPFGHPRPWRAGSEFAIDDLRCSVAGKDFCLRFSFPQQGVITWASL
jgi:hypothetical protein